MSALDQILTQQVVLERDMGGTDSFGAELPPDWQPLVTVPCRFWWWKQGYRGPAKEAVSPERTVPVGDGAIAVAAGVDVTEQDRVGQVLNRDNSVYHEGPLNILAVQVHETHVELIVRRP